MLANLPFQTQKTICKHLLEDPYIYQVINDPLAAAKVSFLSVIVRLVLILMKISESPTTVASTTKRSKRSKKVASVLASKAEARAYHF